MKLQLPLSVWPTLLACALCATAAKRCPCLVSKFESSPVLPNLAQAAIWNANL